MQTTHGNLNVPETGQGAPLVFLHGNPDSHHVWSGVVERLKATHRCITPDLPGYGDSDEQLDVSLDAQAELIKQLLDGLGIEKADLVIHDVGSTYGCAFISKYPERVRTVSIMNGAFFPDFKWHFWGRVWRTPVLGELSMLFGTEGLFISQIQKAAPKMPAEYLKVAFSKYGKKTRRQVVRYYRYMSPSRWEGWDQRLLAALANIKHQVLWGDLDPYIPKAFADRYGGTVHHFADSSHWVMAEDPEPVAKLVADLAR
jgi:pimeloyl-ACP methyl ester carboxylesterase